MYLESIKKLNSSGAPILKYHLSSALKINPTNEALRQLAGMQEPTYLHQCIGRTQRGGLIYFKDIPEALVDPSLLQNLTELRVHFHLPLHSEPVNKDFSNTTDFLKKVIGTIKGSTTPACELEIETYTWEVLPPSLRSKNVTDQIVSEYRWVLSELAQQRIEPAP